MVNPRNLLIAFLVIFFVTSCANTPRSAPYRKIEKKMKGDGNYTPIERGSYYFLPRIPLWANFSETGKCRRNEEIYYLDILKMNKSFNLSYKDSLQIQFLMNKKIANRKNQKHDRIMNLSEEEMAFYEAKEEISNGGHLPFNPPDFKLVNMIWVDPFFTDLNKLTRLKSFMNSKTADLGQIVFVSLCYSYLEIDRFIKENRFDEVDIRIISDEMFNIYDSKNNLGFHLKLELNHFFNSKQDIDFYVLDGVTIPRQFEGTFKIKKMP